MDEVVTPEVESTSAAAVESAPETQSTAPAVAETPDRGKLETTVGSKMSSVFKDADDDEVVETPVATEKDPATGEVKVKPAETAEAAVEGEQKAETPATPAKVNPATQVVPAAYSRSLKAYGWTEEEIALAYKADPANFLRTAAKFHENRNEETRRMADMGRLLKQQTAQQVQTPANQTATFDIAALKKTYGDKEPFIAQLEILNRQLETQQKWVQTSQENQQRAESEAMGRQIDGFFGGKDMTEYSEVYGKSAVGMTPEQTAARMKVLETADLLIRGGRAAGRTLTLEDALTMAHDSVSGPVKTQAIRKQIVDQAKTRNAAISLRPGARTNTDSSKNPRKELEATVGKSLNAVFKS